MERIVAVKVVTRVEGGQDLELFNWAPVVPVPVESVERPKVEVYYEGRGWVEYAIRKPR